MDGTHKAQLFEEVIRDLLLAHGFVVEQHEKREDAGYDLVALHGDQKWAIEAKYYRTDRAQVHLIEAAAARLVRALVQLQARKAMLIVSSMLPIDVRIHLDSTYGIVIVDRTDIYVWAAKRPDLIDRFVALTETTDPLSNEKSGRRLEDAIAKGQDPATHRVVPDTTGTMLYRELRQVKPGRDDWSAYEMLCDRILRYLFPNDLTGWRKQAGTDDDLNRFDYICRINPTTAFWRFLTEHLGTRYALFEFKNYAGKLRQSQILTTEKYLLERALRRTALVISRHGSEDSATKMAQGAMREHGKLIMVVDDKQVGRMLHMKEQGEDPGDFLFELADDFLISLPR
jgi:hypothetical protein